jgi:hypothetical protein
MIEVTESGFVLIEIVLRTVETDGGSWNIVSLSSDDGYLTKYITYWPFHPTDSMDLHNISDSSELRYVCLFNR